MAVKRRPSGDTHPMTQEDNPPPRKPVVVLGPTLTAVRDHSRQYAEFTYVYPVISRRSQGLSLGVNLNPDKVCNFDCIYCEVDRRLPGKVAPVVPSRIRDELTALIRWVKDGSLGREPKFSELPEALTREIKDVAFSGDGEPTMIHNFADCVQAVAEVKNAEALDRTKMVLITDAAGLDKTDVKRGLAILDANQDEIWGKLDAGTEAYFRLVNRTTIRFDRILKNLTATSRVRPIVIQSLFLRVHGETMAPAELEAYCGRLNTILGEGGQIKEVHAYTVARPTPEAYATKLARADLEAIAETIRRRTGLRVLSFE
jgi:wyosine [tRNA(Phe)-imidazoG37] synthetase (radical SAM superfamily)